MAPPLAANSILFLSHTFRAYRRPSGNYAAPARERQHDFRAGDSGTLSVVTEKNDLPVCFLESSPPLGRHSAFGFDGHAPDLA
jgi:hypothetical protein